MEITIEAITPRAGTNNGTELDAVCHPRDLIWKSGERKAIKRGINRRHRRQTRQLLREAMKS